MKKFNLSKQLLCIMVVIFLLLTASIGYLLPTVLLPVYEDNIYTMLKQPLEFVSSDVRENSYNSNVAYLISFSSASKLCNNSSKHFLAMSGL